MLNKGAISATCAYILWGIFPLFWKNLKHVPATELLAHRISWAFVFLILLLIYQRNWNWIKPTLADKRVTGAFVGAALLLALNWGLYIWAVNSNYIIEASLGYFINPLVNIVLATLLLKEQLRVGQWAAIAVAASGVLYLTFVYGRPPWIALTLAFSFATYGLLKKRGSLNATEGLSFEISVLLVPAVGFVLYLQSSGDGAFVSAGLSTSILLIATGLITAIPLLLFAYGAQRINFSTLGLLQYIAPSMQFLLGVFVYNEPFTRQQLVGFVLIWLALVIYSAESLNNYRQNSLRLAPSSR